MLVGRENEIARISSSLDAGTSVVIAGQPGIGKSALLGAVGATRSARVWRGGGLLVLADVPYLSLSRALGCNLPEGDRATVSRTVLEGVGGGLLVLDDLQWADDATYELLPALGKHCSLVMAVRVGDRRSDAALVAAQAAGATVVELGPLTNAESARFLRLNRPDVKAGSASALLAAAAGNPLLLEQLLPDGGVTETLRMSLLARLDRCTPAARRAFLRLALLGRPAELDLLEGCEAELGAAGLIETGALATVRHALLGELALDEEEASLLADLRAELAAAVDDKGEAARLLLAAGRHEQAREAALVAAEMALTRIETAAHLAIAAFATTGRDREMALLAAAWASLRAGACGRALELLEPVGSGDSAEVELVRARALWELGDADGARGAVARGKLLEARPAVRAGLLAAGAQHDVWDVDSQGAGEGARLALALAGDNPTVRTQALYALAAAHSSIGDRSAISRFRLALQEASGADEPMLEAEIADSYAATALMYDRVAEARSVLEAGLAASERAGLAAASARFRMGLIRIEIIADGSFQRGAEQLRELVRDPLLGWDESQSKFLLIEILGYMGRFREARLTIESVGQPQTAWETAHLHASRAEVEWLAGNFALAQRDIEAADGLAPTIDELTIRLRGWLALEAGGSLPEPLTSVTYPLFAPALVETRAIRSFCDQDYASAEEQFAEAAAGWRSRHVHFGLLCEWASGEAARLGGARERATAALLAARERSAAHALAAVTGRTDRSLRALGVRRRRVRPVGNALTQREREVLLHVGEGLTTREIARLLSITPSTVNSIIRNAMAKLDTKTRIQAAAAVANA